MSSEEASKIPGIAIPEEMRSLRQCPEDTKFKTKLMIDGVAGLSKTLKMFRPITTVRFRENLKVQQAKGKTFKGFSVLRGSSCYELDLSMVGGFTLSIIFPTEITIPPAYLEYPKFTSRIYRSLRSSIRLVYANNANTSYHSGLSTPLQVHPEQWDSFSETFQKQLSRELQDYQTKIMDILKSNKIDINYLNTEKFRKPIKELQNWNEFGSFPFSCSSLTKGEFYFRARRLGQDLEMPDSGKQYLESIKKDDSDANQEKFEIFENWVRAWDVYDTFRMHESEHEGCRWLAFHIARDIESLKEKTHIVWIHDNIMDCRHLFLNFDNYNNFCIPGVANFASYLCQAHDSMRFIQFYCRFGHEFHRNSTGVFTRSMVITKRLVEMMGAKFSGSKRNRPMLTNVDRQILDGIPEKQVKNWIEDAGDWGSVARLEIVFEADRGNTNRWEFVMDRESPRCFSWMLLGALTSFLGFTEMRKLTDPRLFLEIPSSIMQMWLQKALSPCCKAISSGNAGLINSIEECIHESFYDLQKVFYAEAIISFFIGGKLPSGFPEVFNMDLRFKELSLEIDGLFVKKIGDTWQIANVEASEDGSLTVLNIPITMLAKLMPEWLLGGRKFDNSFHGIYLAYNTLRHTPTGKKSQISKEYKKAVKTMALQIILLLQKLNCSDAPPRIDCINTRLLASRPSCNFKKRILISSDQFWKILLDHSRDRNTLSQLLIYYFQCIVTADLLLIDDSQLVSLEMFFVFLLDDMIIKEETPFFCWLLPEELFCIMPTVASLIKIENKTKTIIFRNAIDAVFTPDSIFKKKSNVLGAAVKCFLNHTSEISTAWLETAFKFTTSPYHHLLEVLRIIERCNINNAAKNILYEATAATSERDEQIRFISADVLGKLIEAIKGIDHQPNGD